ncbi:T9SS type A sorting domain-containing protein [Polaribacter sp.]|nr:T9SS type A sorting domain-containing protein [Polaribacter sp.]
MNYYQTLKTLAVTIFMGCSILSTQAQIYVDAAATTGANDGTSWANAYTDLQSALDAAAENAEIRVAAGTYKPTEAPVTSTDNRDKAFHFDIDLVLKGSYNPVTDAQDFTNRSILSGDFDGDDVITGSGSTLSISGNSENAYHVLMTAGLTTAAQIEGFLITGGGANGDGGTISYSGKNFYNDSGAGMYHISSSPSIVNTIFSENSASFFSSGMYNSNSSSPSIVNTVFSRNSGTDGGGMYNGNFSSPSIVNTVFNGNKAGVGSGMYNSNSSSPNIVNTVFSGNEATSSSGGIHNNNNNSPTIYNSVFYGNGSDIVNSASASTTGGSNFSEHYAETGFTALTADPFSDSANPIGADGIWFTTDDGLQPSSATSPITDEGDATKLPLDTLDLDGGGDTTKAIPVDITGRTRIAGTALDAGAYEHDSAVLSVKDIDSSKLDIYSTGYKTLVIHGVFNAKNTANVYSLQGKLVASKTFEKFSTSSSLDVSTLFTGIYIVKMHNANHQVQTKKLFIQ